MDAVSIPHEWVRRLTRAEYRRLGETGILDEDERVELLYGQVVVMSAVDTTHEESCWEIGERLRRKLGDRAKVRTNLSFAASDDSEPRPDIMVAPQAPYWDEHPTRAHLIVEVSRTSLRKDLGIKRRLYGEVDVEEYWVIDVDDGRVHILRDADEHGAWRFHQVVERGAVLTVSAFPDVQIAVSDILPPR